MRRGCDVDGALHYDAFANDVGRRVVGPDDMAFVVAVMVATVPVLVVVLMPVLPMAVIVAIMGTCCST